MSRESGSFENHPIDQPGTEFHELIRHAKSGDQQAVGRLVEQCRDYLLLIANEDLDASLQGKFGASDLVQDTMLIAHQKFDQFRGQTPAELKGWLRQILRNDLHRARRQFLDADRRDIKREQPIEAAPRGSTHFVDHCPTPRTDAIVQEEARLLNEAMARLPENYRMAVRLREWEDLSFPEIGRQMGISEEAARKLCRRGMDQLAEMLRPAVREFDATASEGCWIHDATS